MEGPGNIHQLKGNVPKAHNMLAKYIEADILGVGDKCINHNDSLEISLAYPSEVEFEMIEAFARSIALALNDRAIKKGKTPHWGVKCYRVDETRISVSLILNLSAPAQLIDDSYTDLEDLEAPTSMLIAWYEKLASDELKLLAEKEPLINCPVSARILDLEREIMDILTGFDNAGGHAVVLDTDSAADHHWAEKNGLTSAKHFEVDEILRNACSRAKEAGLI